MALPTWRGHTGAKLAANKFHTTPHGCHGHRMFVLLLLLLLFRLQFSVSVSSSVRCGIICKMSLLVWILRSSKPRRSNWRSSAREWVEVIHRRPEHVSLCLCLWLWIKVKHTQWEAGTSGRMIWFLSYLPTRLVYHHQGWSWAYAIQAYTHISVCGIAVFIVYL